MTSSSSIPSARTILTAEMGKGFPARNPPGFGRPVDCVGRGMPQVCPVTPTLPRARVKIAGALSMIVAATAAAKTAAAQTALAKAKGNHARAKAALTNADALAPHRKTDLE